MKFITPFDYDNMCRRVAANRRDHAMADDQPPAEAPRACRDAWMLTSKRQLCLTIPGQIMGGKNNMLVTRTGRHFPKRSWAQWRDRVVIVVRGQLPADWTPISKPCIMSLTYVPGDRRRRDMPAIVDSIFHCLERAGVVADDSLLWVNQSVRCESCKEPKAVIVIEVPE